MWCVGLCGLIGTIIFFMQHWTSLSSRESMALEKLIDGSELACRRRKQLEWVEW
jgi:hypothetical protein